MNVSRCFDRLLPPAILLSLLLQAPPAIATTIYEGFNDQIVDREVLASTYFNGDLIVGGNFNWAGGVTGSKYLARWNGTKWMGMNMPGAANGAVVEVLAVHKGELFVGGHMHSIDGAPSDNIIRWDGTTWKGLVYGVNGPVYALLPSGNDLYVAGNFISAGSVPMSHVARWDGTAWHALGSGLNGTVGALVEYGGELVAGGSFNWGGGTTVQVAAWNGSTWHALGQPLSGVTGPGSVGSLAVFNGVLVAAGSFLLPGGNNLAWLDGNVWKPLGGGAGNFGDRPVNSLAVAGGKLYVGGYCLDVGTGATALAVNNVASWDGTAWSALTSGVTQSDEGSWCSDLFANGTNVVVGGRFELAGGLDAENVAIWNGSSWSNPSNSGNGVNAPVKALITSGRSLIVGGVFTAAGGQPVHGVARWDGVWHSYGEGFQAPSASVSQVNAVAELNGEVIAGGNFTLSGAQPMNHIARWDGTSWNAMGSGLDGTVNALAIYNGQLFAGGSFTTAGGQSMSRIARWDGTTWQPVGNGLGKTVLTLMVYNGELYAGTYDSGLFKWNGTGWSYPGCCWYWVESMTTLGSSLVVTGGTNRLERLNGTVWSTMPSPTGGPYDIANYYGTLVGEGTVAGGQTGVIALDQGLSWTLMAAITGIQRADQCCTYGSMLFHDAGFVKGLFVGGDFVQMGGVSSRSIALINPEIDLTAIEPEDPVASRLQVSPNPFQRSLSVAFTLQAPGQVEVTVFDLAGRRVATVLDGSLAAGPHEASWDGRDSRGERVRAGTYFIRAREGDRVESRQVVLID